MDLHETCVSTEKAYLKAERKARKASHDLIYWMRVTDIRPQEYADAKTWLAALAGDGDDCRDEFIEGNFQKLKKWTARAEAAYDAWNAAVEECAHDVDC